MISTAESVFLVTAGYDHTIRFWETLTGSCYRIAQHNESQVNKLVISPDKKYVVAAGNPQVRFYDLETSKTMPEKNYEGHTSSVTAVGFQCDNQWMYTASEDGTIKIWDMRAQGCQRDYKLNSMVETATLHPNQVEIISGEQSGRISIWDLRANDLVEQLIPENDAAMRSVSLSANGKTLCATTNTGKVYIWGSKSSTIGKNLKPVSSAPHHGSSQIVQSKFSPDMTMLATCAADKTCKLWNTHDWSLKMSLNEHTNWVWDCSFSADSEYLVTASSDKTCRLWDLNKGDTIRVFAGHQKAVTCLALHDESLINAALTAQLE